MGESVLNLKVVKKQSSLSKLHAALLTHFGDQSFTRLEIPGTLISDLGLTELSVRRGLRYLRTSKAIEVIGTRDLGPIGGSPANIYKVVNIPKIDTIALTGVSRERVFKMYDFHVRYCQSLEKQVGRNLITQNDRHAVATTLGLTPQGGRSNHFQCLELGLLVAEGQRVKGFMTTSRLSDLYFEKYALAVNAEAHASVNELNEKENKLITRVVAYCQALEKHIGSGLTTLSVRHLVRDEMSLAVYYEQSLYSKALNQGLLITTGQRKCGTFSPASLSALYFANYALPVVKSEPEAVEPEPQGGTPAMLETATRATTPDVHGLPGYPKSISEFCIDAYIEFGGREFTTQERDNLAKNWGKLPSVASTRCHRCIDLGLVESRRLSNRPMDGSMYKLTQKYFDLMGIQVGDQAAAQEVSCAQAMEVAEVQTETPLEVAPLEVAPLEVAPLEVVPLEVVPLEVVPLEVVHNELTDNPAVKELCDGMAKYFDHDEFTSKDIATLAEELNISFGAILNRCDRARALGLILNRAINPKNHRFGVRYHLTDKYFALVKTEVVLPAGSASETQVDAVADKPPVEAIQPAPQAEVAAPLSQIEGPKTTSTSLPVSSNAMALCAQLYKKFANREFSTWDRNALAEELGTDAILMRQRCVTAIAQDLIFSRHLGHGPRNGAMYHLTKKYFDLAGITDVTEATLPSHDDQDLVGEPVSLDEFRKLRTRERADEHGVTASVREYCALLVTAFGKKEFTSDERDRVMTKHLKCPISLVRSRHQMAIKQGMVISKVPYGNRNGSVNRLSDRYFELFGQPVVVKTPKPVVTPSLSNGKMLILTPAEKELFDWLQVFDLIGPKRDRIVESLICDRGGRREGFIDKMEWAEIFTQVGEGNQGLIYIVNKQKLSYWAGNGLQVVDPQAQKQETVRGRLETLRSQLEEFNTQKRNFLDRLGRMAESKARAKLDYDVKYRAYQDAEETYRGITDERATLDSQYQMYMSLNEPRAVSLEREIQRLQDDAAEVQRTTAVNARQSEPHVRA